MKKNALCFILTWLVCYAKAQVKAETILEGGKTLIELIRFLKPTKTGYVSSHQSKDSCEGKKTAGLCFKNTTANTLLVGLFRKKENGYEATPFELRILKNSEECWFEISASVYLYKITVVKNGEKENLREGEIKLMACQNMQREIKVE